jgi:hypothetical protein
MYAYKGAFVKEKLSAVVESRMHQSPPCLEEHWQAPENDIMALV